MPKLYTKGKARYYADLRDVGLRQHALKRPGSSRATQDEAEALVLMGKLIERLRIEGPSIRGSKDALGVAAEAFLRRNPRRRHGAMAERTETQACSGTVVVWGRPSPWPR